MSCYPSRTRWAFTLVELLVVIGIIALLISILLPVLGKVRRQAEWTACCSNLRQIGVAVRMYVDENKGFVPRPAGGWTLTSDDDIVWWQVSPVYREFDQSAIAKYLKVKGDKLKGVWRCPTDVNVEDRPTFPGRAQFGPYRYSYSMNDRFHYTGAGTSRNFTKVRNATEKSMIGEETEYQINDCLWAILSGDDWLSTRHGGMGNILYCDGHVGKMIAADLKKSKNVYEPFRNFGPPNAAGLCQEFDNGGNPIGSPQ